MDLRKKDNKFETNPFILDLKGKMYLQPRANTIVAKGEAILDTQTGEILKDETVLLGRRKTVDKSQFAKVYVSELGILMDLSKTAINVLIYLMGKMDYENKSYLNSEDYVKLNYKSSLSVIKGLKELIKNSIIAPAVMPHYYWLNPMYICKGERFAIYTEYVTKEYAEQERKENQKKQMEDQQKALNDVSYKIEAMNQQDDTDYNRIQELESELNQLKNKNNQFKNL